MSRCPAVSGMGDDSVTIADRLTFVNNVRQLPARRRRRIENVLVPERHAVNAQESEYLEAIAVGVGNAEQLGIGIERDHGTSAETATRASVCNSPVKSRRHEDC